MRVSFAADQATIADLRRTLIEVGLAGAAGGALLGAALAWRLSRRLRVAAAAAEQVTAGSLSARVNARGSDEVAALGAAMDRMADSLQERIEHEQRFVANVAHDLRTPVTGLVAAASLLEPDQVGAVVRERVSRLHTLVEDLLEISRLENGAVTADLRWVDVDAFVRSLVGRRPGVVADASEPARAFTDPRRLERIIDNLLDNSARHGAPPVVVAVRGQDDRRLRLRAGLRPRDARARDGAVRDRRHRPRSRDRPRPRDRRRPGARARRLAAGREPARGRCAR